MKVFSKLIFINKSTDLIKFRYVKEHETTDSTWGFINGEVPKEFEDREYKWIEASNSELSCNQMKIVILNKIKSIVNGVDINQEDISIQE